MTDMTGKATAALVFGGAHLSPAGGPTATDGAASDVQLSLTQLSPGKLSFSVVQHNQTLATTGTVGVKDKLLTVSVDARVAGQWDVYVNGDKGLTYAVRVNISNEGLTTMALSADTEGVKFTSVGADTTPYVSGMLTTLAKEAMDSSMAHFWLPDEQRFNEQHVMVWIYGMLMLGLEDMYNATGDEQYKTYIEQEWAYMQLKWPGDRITRAGTDPNNWMDDMAWTSMVLMEIYRVTKDMNALRLAGETVRNAYTYFADGSTANGLWYDLGTDTPRNKNLKSVYQVGLILTGLQYCSIVSDPALYNDTIALYNWGEAHLRRADGFYWCDYLDGPNTVLGNVVGPIGQDDYDSIGIRGGRSCIFGNMGMAAVNALLYQSIGDQTYLDKALQTANGLGDNPAYNVGGVLVNDRDAWTDAAFAGQFVQLVLPLPGIGDNIKNAIKNTAISIATTARSADGTYGPIWSAASGQYWVGATIDNKPVTGAQIQTCGTSVHMVAAGALLEKLGLVP